MKKRIVIAVFSCLTALWIGFIWINSMQVGVVSGEMSGSLTEGINEFFGSFIDGFYISGYVVRKLAHFTEFALLALLLCFDCRFIFDIDKRSTLRRASCVWLALPCAVAVACIDESIQLSVEGRVGSFVDVLIDSAGALFCVALFFGVLMIMRARAKKSAHLLSPHER